MKTATKGMVQVYTGDGKGKTTAALGLALRAVGRGLQVIILQFLKGPVPTGERLAAEKLAPLLTIKPMGRSGFVHLKHPDAEDVRLAAEAMRAAREILQENKCDVLILDEVNVAAAFGLVKVEEVLELIRNKPETMELVLTGRHADPRIIEAADLVTEMKGIKHYFEKGVGDREGIER